MSHVEDELTSQPECWARAASQAPDHAGVLPAPGERVAIVGCGTSYFMAQAAAALREGAGQGETDAFAASEFPHGRAYDRVVALTRSGTTTEVLGLLGRLAGWWEVKLSSGCPLPEAHHGSPSRQSHVSSPSRSSGAEALRTWIPPSSSAVRTTPPGVAGAGWPVRRQKAAIASGIRGGRMNDSSSGLIRPANGGACSARCISAS